MKRIFTLGFFCAILAMTPVAQAAEEPEATAWGVPEIFSDMSYGSESGDIGGTEILLIPGDGETWALIQIAEGVPKGPVLLKVEVKDNQFEFALPKDKPAYENYGKFKAQISDAGLKLWVDGEEYGFLKRQCSRP